MKKDKDAFTLIELLVVVAIIGILAAVGVVAYNGYTSSAKVNAVKSNFKIVQKKLGEAVTACSSGLDFYWADGNNCQNRPINADTMAWGVYGDFSKTIKSNPYDENTKAIEWSQLSDGFANCPPKKPPKGQINSTYVAFNKKAFTLIELLVVVAIIGILAAVGVVAYNGYTKSAKVAATKSQHKTIVKFMQSEIMKCSLGQSNLELKRSSGANTNVSCDPTSVNTITLGSRFVDHFRGDSFK